MALGKIRDSHSTHINQSSIVLENDGIGRYRRAAVLPLPAYFGGFTSVPSLTSANLDADGALNLILGHQRNDGADLPGEPFTGRYVQVLINQGGFHFEDRTAVLLATRQVRVDVGPRPAQRAFAQSSQRGR